MTKVEYYAMFESLLYGLALAHILVVCSKMIANRKTIKFYWAHFLLVSAGLFVIAQRYYAGYDAVEYAHVGSAVEFLFLIMLPMALFFVLAYQIFPEKIEGANLKEFFYEKSKEFIAVFISFAIVVAIRNIITDMYQINDGLIEREGYYSSGRFLTFFVTIMVLAILGGGALFTNKKWILKMLIIIAFAFNLYILIITK